MCLAVPGKVLSIIEGSTSFERKGKVDFGGVLKEVNLAYVPEVKVGEYVIVHVGFAISILNQAEAERVFEYLKQIDELNELKELKEGI